jgi:hypothetical protein
MNPRYVILLCCFIYVLFATLGIIELYQVIQQDYQQPLFICFFIFNVIYMLGVTTNAFYMLSDDANDGFYFFVSIIPYSVGKFILASFTIDVLRYDDDIPNNAMILFIIEIVLIFGPICFGILGYIIYELSCSLCRLASQDQRPGPIVFQLTESLVSHRFIAHSIWITIITYLTLGIFDMIQCVTEDYLRALFIFITIENMLFPTLTTLVFFHGDSDVFAFLVIIVMISKIVTASISLHAVTVDHDISIMAQVLCYFEIVPIFSFIAAILLLLITYICDQFQFCHQYLTVPEERQPPRQVCPTNNNL